MELSRHSSAKTRIKTTRAHFMPLVLAMLALPSVAVQGAWAGGGRGLSGAAKTLMLVREWDAESGLLTGWLPLHSVEIQLQLLSQNRGNLNYEPGRAIYVKIPTYSDSSWRERVQVAPAPHVFQGESWLPAKYSMNLVRIGKEIYVLRSLAFREGEPPGAMASSSKGVGP